MNPLATRAQKEEYEALQVAICFTKCPPAKPFCPLKKAKDQSYDDYLAKCNDLAAKAKEAFDALPKAASAENEEDEELL